MHSTEVRSTIWKYIVHPLIKISVITCIIAWFSLNAMAAEPAGAISIQEHLARMKTMTPEERTQEREAMRQEIQDLTPEQRAARRKKMREHWEKMPPEERRDMRAKMQEYWKNMPPEERAARRREMRHKSANSSGRTCRAICLPACRQPNALKNSVAARPSGQDNYFLPASPCCVSQSCRHFA
jgi:hypothetical protein